MARGYAGRPRGPPQLARARRRREAARRPAPATVSREPSTHGGSAPVFGVATRCAAGAPTAVVWAGGPSADTSGTGAVPVASAAAGAGAAATTRDAGAPVAVTTTLPLSTAMPPATKA